MPTYMVTVKVEGRCVRKPIRWHCKLKANDIDEAVAKALLYFCKEHHIEDVNSVREEWEYEVWIPAR